MKYLYLSLLLTFSLPALGFDRDFDDPDNGVQETKGGPQVAADSASQTLKFRLGRTSFSIPPRIINQFELLSQLAENSSEDTSLPEKYPFTANNLRLLLKFLTDHETKKLSLTQQSDLLNLADYLLINNWRLMNPILKQIQAQVTLEKLSKLSPPSINVPILEPEDLKNTRRIYWSPTGDHYVVLFDNGHSIRLKDAQLYDATGEPQGALLHGVYDEVKDIEWSPKGNRYAVHFDRSMGIKFYDVNGEQLEYGLKRAVEVSWSPNGEKCFIGFDDNTLQLYDAARRPQGKPLKNVRNIFWSPNGEWYWIVFYDEQAQLYNTAGEPQEGLLDQAYFRLGIQRGSKLSNVRRIIWSPKGDKYFVIFKDDRRNTAQLYNFSGKSPMANSHEYVANINWSPNNVGYVVEYTHGGAQLYNIAGERLGNGYTEGYKIKWSPKGDRFWVIFSDKQAQLYNSAGEPQSGILNSIYNITWLPKGDRYIIDFYLPHYDYYKTEIYNANGALQDGPFQNTSMSPSGDRYAMRFNNGYMFIDYIYSNLFESLNFGQRLLVQAILNEHDITGAPVTVDANLLIKYELPKSVYKKLLEKRLISVKNSYLNNWNTMTKNLALTARLAAQSPTFSKAMKLPRKPS